MIGVIPHPKLLPDDRGDPFRGPDIAQEPVGFGSPRQQRRELRPLVRGQPGRGPGRRFGAQRVLASFAQPFQRVMEAGLHRPAGDVESSRDLIDVQSFLWVQGSEEYQGRSFRPMQTTSVTALQDRASAS